MNVQSARSVTNALNKLKNKNKAEVLSRYFKTGKGEYGHGDIFLGITVPEQRKIARKFKGVPLSEIKKLLTSKIHEYRFTALLILCLKPLDKEVYDFYLMHLVYINNWDLVDTSAPDIVGKYLFERNRGMLEVLVDSNSLWDRRIAVIATYYFIKKKDFSTTLLLSERLLSDHHDLIHKAVGWMLREIGKRNMKVLKDFLNKFSKTMPRTALRYAIEHFSPEERKAIMFG